MYLTNFGVVKNNGNKRKKAIQPQKNRINSPEVSTESTFVQPEISFPTSNPLIYHPYEGWGKHNQTTNSPPVNNMYHYAYQQDNMTLINDDIPRPNSTYMIDQNSNEQIYQMGPYDMNESFEITNYKPGQSVNMVNSARYLPIPEWYNEEKDNYLALQEKMGLV